MIGHACVSWPPTTDRAYGSAGCGVWRTSGAQIRRWPERNHAFTLVEIVVAIGILAVSLMGIIAVSGSAIDSSREAEENFHAVQIAANSLDALRSTSSDIPASFPPRFFDDQGQPLADSEATDAIYRLDIEGSQTAARPGQSTLHARVTYPWLGSSRDGQSVKYFTTIMVLNPAP